MVQPSRPTNQCYAVLAVTVLAIVVLYILVPVVAARTARACPYSRPNHGPADTLTAAHATNGSNSTHTSQDERLQEGCTFKDYLVYLYWIPISGIVILWLVVMLCITCTDYTCYTFCSHKARAGSEHSTKHKNCRALRAQISYFQCSRFKSKFSEHPMLSHLDHTDAEDHQLLAYIRVYLEKAWQLRPPEATKTRAKNYTIKVRHVYKISNSKLWDQYNGDKSSLQDIMQKLINATAINKLSAKAVKTLSQPVEESTEAESEEERWAEGAEHVAPLVSQEDLHTDDTQAEEEEEDQASLQSMESTPLLARSWNNVQFPDRPENCMFLLHGTEITNAFNIIENGFDVNRMHNGQYGKAVYLTESTWIADKYTNSKQYPRNTNLMLLIVRTSLRHAYWRLSDEHVPPSISKNYAALVSGSHKGHRQFRVFHSKNCYPEFLILYDRVYPSTYWPRRNTKPELAIPQKTRV